MLVHLSCVFLIVAFVVFYNNLQIGINLSYKTTFLQRPRNVVYRVVADLLADLTHSPFPCVCMYVCLCVYVCVCVCVRLSVTVFLDA